MTSINKTSGITATPTSYSSAAKAAGKDEKRPLPPMPPEPSTSPLPSVDPYLQINRGPVDPADKPEEVAICGGGWPRFRWDPDGAIDVWITSTAFDVADPGKKHAISEYQVMKLFRTLSRAQVGAIVKYIKETYEINYDQEGLKSSFITKTKAQLKAGATPNRGEHLIALMDSIVGKKEALHPDESIKKLRLMLDADLRAVPARPVEEYKTFKYLARMNIQPLCSQILLNYRLELGYPGNSIMLAKAKSRLLEAYECLNKDPNKPERICMDFTPYEAIVLIYSMLEPGARHGTMAEIKPLRYMPDEGKNPGMINKLLSHLDDNNLLRLEYYLFSKPRMTVRDRVDRMTIIMDDRSMLTDTDTDNRVLKMYDYARRMGMLLSLNPITRVSISDDIGVSSYIEWAHLPLVTVDIKPLINISKKDFYKKNFRDTFAHEYGHYVFDAKFIDPQDEIGPYHDCNKLFVLFQEYDAWEIARDAEYTDESISYGHPNDAPTELFASAFVAYTLYPDKMLNFIKHLNVNKRQQRDMQMLGRLLWCYMRDDVFLGRTFTKEDPYKDVTFYGLMKRFEGKYDKSDKQ